MDLPASELRYDENYPPPPHVSMILDFLVACTVFVRKSEGRDYLEDVALHNRIIMK
jgi:hypothetical protein